MQQAVVSGSLKRRTERQTATDSQPMRNASRSPQCKYAVVTGQTGQIPQHTDYVDMRLTKGDGLHITADVAEPQAVLI